jgi:DivIVA domain-containing protein
MDVTPQELRGSEIKDSWRGYDRDEVDDLLERAAVTIEGLAQRVQEASSRPPRATANAPVAPEPVPLPSSRDDADMLQRTLLLAQRAADEAVNEAQTRSREMLEASEAKAQALVSDAETTARRIAEGERRRLEAEIVELSSRREQLRNDADALDSYASSYRDRLRAAIEADLARLGGEIDPPGPRPELHSVEIPPPPEPTAVEPANNEPAESATADTTAIFESDVFSIEESDGDTNGRDAGPDTRALGAAGSTDAPFASAPSPVAAPVRPAPEWPPAPTVDQPPTASAASSWLSSADEWAPAEQVWEAPAPWERETAVHDAPFQDSARAEDAGPPAAFASDVPMDANPVDTDSLDDDAFFASLREAVRDDVPLGPRDDEQSDFFESELEQDRRRFRRRR